MATQDDGPLYTVDFAFQDLLGAEIGEDPNDFVTAVQFKVHTEQEEPGGRVELVGKGHLSLIHFGLAMDAGYPLHTVMDATSSILSMSETLFSWEEGGDPFDKLDDHFREEPIFNRDVCFVERMEVLPAHRGRGIGRDVLEAIARRFYNSCGLMVLKAYPLQHEERAPGILDEWAKAMRYDALEQDLERAQYQLFSWYQQMGLSKPFDLEYFIARPGALAHLPSSGNDSP
jgi:GNAT superfamily N-acetyltransferase